DLLVPAEHLQSPALTYFLIQTLLTLI
ncbi:hypothetical protein GCK32_014144, partial [Trichostrongylus colubriformis]